MLSTLLAASRNNGLRMRHVQAAPRNLALIDNSNVSTTMSVLQETTVTSPPTTTTVLHLFGEDVITFPRIKKVGRDALALSINSILLLVSLFTLALPIRILLRVFTSTKMASVRYKSGLNAYDSVMYINALTNVDEDEETESPPALDEGGRRSSGFSAYRLFRR